MQYKRPTDEQTRLVRLDAVESELQSQFDTDALRPVVRGALDPTPPGEARTIFTPQKASASATPGTEYWLP